MEHPENNEITREEIKKEFQLERMVLFSDAVFAIVITLMAIEIKIPESEVLTDANLPEVLSHLLPTLLAYIVSFGFIGSIWYQHLKMFSLLKDFDSGLVFRNMLLLFFIGLFPFSATLISRSHGQMGPFFIYLCVILFCVIAQYILYYYILRQRPSIRINTDLSAHEKELYKKKILAIGFSITGILIMVTYVLIPDPEMKGYAMCWMILYAFIFKVLIKRKKIRKLQIGKVTE
jgi:TMEM175 potassium channel family protein